MEPNIWLGAGKSASPLFLLTDKHALNILKYFHQRYLEPTTINLFDWVHKSHSIEYLCETAFPDRGPLAGYPAIHKLAVKRGLNIPEKPPNPKHYEYNVLLTRLGWGARLLLKRGQLYERYLKVFGRLRYQIDLLPGSKSAELRVLYIPVSLQEKPTLLKQEIIFLEDLVEEKVKPNLETYESFIQNPSKQQHCSTS